MTVTDLQATATIGGHSMSGYLVQLSRKCALTRMADSFELSLAIDMPHALQPWDTVVLTEMGTLTLTGYVDKVVRAREPEHAIRVIGRNTFKRAEDYFISDHQLVTHGETAAYWIGYLCNLCGLSYSIDSPNSGRATIDGYGLGLQSAADALALFAALMQCNMRVTPAGVLEFVHLSIGEPDYIFDPLEGEREIGDEWTRNVAKVWGMAPDGEQLLYQARVDLGILANDRIMVVANPNIQTVSQAIEITSTLLSHFASQDEVSSFLAVGNPNVRVGQVGQVTIQPGVDHIQFVTDLAAQLDSQGYALSLALGRKNYLLPDFPMVPLETGEPTPLVEFETVPGIAFSQFLHGNFIYTGGRTSTTPVRYRLEKRLTITGELLWGVEGTFPSGAGTGTIYGVWADDHSVYALGSDGTFVTLAEFNASNGARNWTNSYPEGAGQLESGGRLRKLRGDSTGVYGLGGLKNWIGTDFTGLLRKYSRTDGSVLWTADSSRDIPGGVSNDRQRYFYHDLDVHSSFGPIYVVGQTGVGFEDIISNANKQGWRATFDRSTGAFLSETYLTGTGTLGGLTRNNIDRYNENYLWGAGRHPSNSALTTGDQYLVRSGPTLLTSASKSDSASTHAYRSVFAGLLYVYDLWYTGSAIVLRALSKGTLVEIWRRTVTLSGTDDVWDMFYDPVNVRLWFCGQKNSNFYTAYRGI